VSHRRRIVRPLSNAQRVSRAFAVAQAHGAASASAGPAAGGGDESDGDEGDDAISGLERRSPLPVGRYWVDIPASKTAEFAGYLAGNDRVRVEVTEGGGDGGTFFVFRVLAPVPWFAANFGFPNTAGPEIKSRADTVQAPDLPLDGTDAIDAALHSGGALGGLIMTAGLLAGVVYLAGKLIEQRGKGRK
jgi:hypothetical protein